MTTLSYEPTLEDVAEPSIRMYFRSGEAAAARMRSAMISGFLSAVLAYALVRARRSELAPMAAVAAGVFTGMVNWLLFRSAVKRRIRRYVKRQVRSQMPLRTNYAITNSSLNCESAGVTTTFALSDLSEVSEDSQRLEVVFGPKGLCVIPLRAFSSPAEKACFIAALRSPAS